MGRLKLNIVRSPREDRAEANHVEPEVCLSSARLSTNGYALPQHFETYGRQAL
jgi:hypothetical protein